MHPLLLDDEALVAECEVIRQRRGGPGGQHRNKVETAVRLRHISSGITAEANGTRSQERNRKEAIKRLRLKLALGVRSAVSRDSELQTEWNNQCRGSRLPATARATSGPVLAAFALDVLTDRDFDHKAAADRLEVTASQLTKFLASDDNLWSFVNRMRAESGRHPLRR